MNIFKKIGNLASNSWKDFSDYYDQPLDEKDKSEMKLVTKEQSFEVKKRTGAEVEQKKASHGFFKRRFSKKKLLLADPRSPTTEYQRTPIQLCLTNDSTDSGILSPFNVQDMLASIDSALTPTKPSNLELNDKNSASDNLDISLDKEYIATITDWKDFKFNEKILTESLIVEVSTLDINDESNDDFQMQSQLDDLKQITLEEEKQSSNTNCKVIDYVLKNEIDNSTIVEKLMVEEGAPENENLVVTSTPKKTAAIAKTNDEKRIPRTPLVCIRNSPLVNKSLASKNSPATKLKARKKKLTSTSIRQLPKVPQTPLTPLFKSTNQTISQFDNKENY